MMVMSYSCMARPRRGMIGGIYRQEQGHHVAVEGRRRNTVEKNIDNHHSIPGKNTMIGDTILQVVVITAMMGVDNNIYMTIS
ncbi:hypothetical protein ES288_D04G136900v1 [Gossypium darwinii]|nr:hypothetical protein ES288_D04G136900v1 [Gossypium darwinii]TYH77243.1 hypothetical protein ES332_D04G139800v1 [Gossypium tomentosum]